MLSCSCMISLLAHPPLYFYFPSFILFPFPLAFQSHFSFPYSFLGHLLTVKILSKGEKSKRLRYRIAYLGMHYFLKLIWQASYLLARWRSEEMARWKCSWARRAATRSACASPTSDSGVSRWPWHHHNCGRDLAEYGWHRHHNCGWDLAEYGSRSSRAWIAMIFSDPDPTFQLNSDPYPDPVKDPT